MQRVLNPVKEQKPSITFGEFLVDHWLPTYPLAAGNRATTVREKQQHVKHHLVPHVGEVPLHELKGRALDRLFAQLAEKGLSEKSRKNIRATLRKALVSAVEWEMLAALPALPRVRVPERHFDFLTPEEAARVVEAARSPEARLWILFALRTGARAGERLALRWGDIDWNSNKLVVQRSAIRGVEGPTKKRARPARAHVPGAGFGPEGSPASTRPLGVLPSRWEAPDAVAAPRRAGDGLSASWGAPDSLARPPALFRQSAGGQGGAHPARPGVAGALHDHRDHALRPPRSRWGCRADRGVGCRPGDRRLWRGRAEEATAVARSRSLGWAEIAHAHDNEDEHEHVHVFDDRPLRGTRKPKRRSRVATALLAYPI